MKPTPRQQQILDMRAAGMTSKQIAEKLGITPQSVKDHLHQAKMREHKQPGKYNHAISMAAAANRAAILAMLQERAMPRAELLIEFPDIKPKQMEKALARLSSEGAIKTYRWRNVKVWSVSQELADAYFAASLRVQQRAQEMADAAAARQRMAEDEAVKLRQEIRRKAAEKAAKSKPRQMVVIRPVMESVRISTASGREAIIPQGLQIQHYPTPGCRFAPEPGFERTITADWQARRAGADVPTRFAGVY